MMLSKSTSPCPSERKFQPRLLSPNSMCEPMMPERPFECDRRVLHVHVIDPVGEVPQEEMGLHPLPDEVERIEVEAERRPVLELLEQALRAVVVEGYLRRVDLEGEADAAGVELIEDGAPEPHYLLEGLVDHRLGGLGE